ncbi:YiaA/YiaB family inner membrane protein [Streptomyces noursei]|uniref:YiaA/YiaB family inner membrane protein n=1 Tax=Streptomyces noursei TaxID=1971 RepID=UPI00332735F1
MSTPTIRRPTTTAFFVQAALSFGLSLVALVIGIIKLPVGAWERGFLALRSGRRGPGPVASRSWRARRVRGARRARPAGRPGPRRGWSR